MFDNSSMFRISAYMLIPGAIFYFLVIEENVSPILCLILLQLKSYYDHYLLFN